MKLGYAPTTAAATKPMPAWVLAIVPKPKGVVKTIKSGSEDVETDTMPFIMQRIKATAYQTKELAKKLQGSTNAQSLRNAWNFVKTYIRYVEDSKTNEEIRDPSVTIHEAKGDCDCQTVLLGSLFYNMGINFYPRIIKQNNSANWTHIYLVIPKDGKKITSRNSYTVVDCVMDSYDSEPDFTDNKDYNMGLAGLQSLRGTEATSAYCKRKTPITRDLIFYAANETIVDHGLVPTKELLVAQKIPYTSVKDDAGTDMLVVTSKQGENIALPTVITPAEATQVMTISKTTDDVITVDAEVIENTETTHGIKAAKASIGWLAGLILFGVVVSAMTSKKKAATAGLGAVKKSVRRKPVQKRKLNLSIN